MWFLGGFQVTYFCTKKSIRAKVSKIFLKPPFSWKITNQPVELILRRPCREVFGFEQLEMDMAKNSKQDVQMFGWHNKTILIWMMGIRINNKNDNDKLGSSLLEWDLRLCWLLRRGKLCTEDIGNIFYKSWVKAKKRWSWKIASCLLGKNLRLS